MPGDEKKNNNEKTTTSSSAWGNVLLYPFSVAQNFLSRRVAVRDEVENDVNDLTKEVEDQGLALYKKAQGLGLEKQLKSRDDAWTSFIDAITKSNSENNEKSWFQRASKVTEELKQSQEELQKITAPENQDSESVNAAKKKAEAAKNEMLNLSKEETFASQFTEYKKADKSLAESINKLDAHDKKALDDLEKTYSDTLAGEAGKQYNKLIDVINVIQEIEGEKEVGSSLQAGEAINGKPVDQKTTQSHNDKSAAALYQEAKESRDALYKKTKELKIEGELESVEKSWRTLNDLLRPLAQAEREALFNEILSQEDISDQSKETLQSLNVSSDSIKTNFTQYQNSVQNWNSKLSEAQLSDLDKEQIQKSQDEYFTKILNVQNNAESERQKAKNEMHELQEKFKNENPVLKDQLLDINKILQAQKLFDHSKEEYNKKKDDSNLENSYNSAKNNLQGYLEKLYKNETLQESQVEKWNAFYTSFKAAKDKIENLQTISNDIKNNFFSAPVTKAPENTNLVPGPAVTEVKSNSKQSQDADKNIKFSDSFTLRPANQKNDLTLEQTEPVEGTHKTQALDNTPESPGTPPKNHPTPESSDTPPENKHGIDNKIIWKASTQDGKQDGHYKSPSQNGEEPLIQIKGLSQQNLNIDNVSIRSLTIPKEQLNSELDGLFFSAQNAKGEIINSNEGDNFVFGVNFQYDAKGQLKEMQFCNRDFNSGKLGEDKITLGKNNTDVRFDTENNMGYIEIGSDKQKAFIGMTKSEFDACLAQIDAGKTKSKDLNVAPAKQKNAHPINTIIQPMDAISHKNTNTPPRSSPRHVVGPKPGPGRNVGGGV